MKKQYTAEEKKAYYKQQKQDVENLLIEGVAKCYTEGNFRNYLDIVSKFHDYSLNNCMLIAFQMPGATYVAGYNDWKTKYKRHVKAGAKAIRIIAPVPCKFKTEEINADGNKETKTIELLRFKAVSVFDYSQTEGADFPELCKPLTATVEDYDKLIAKLMNAPAVPVTFKETGNEAHGYYDRKNKLIVVRPNMSQAQTVKTMVHEIAHSILHDDAFCDIPKNIKEVQAESVAYMVCSALGIDSSDYSFEYVAAWAKQDMKTLVSQMEIVRKTADAIIDKVSAN